MAGIEQSASNDGRHATLSRLEKVRVDREREINTIRVQYEALLQGKRSVATITGEVGCGKTTLIKAILAELAQGEGICVYGNFKQYSGDEPYVALRQIAGQMIGHILTLPDNKLRRVRRRLIKELGKDVPLITCLVPQLEKVVGHQGTDTVDDVERFEPRFEKAFRNLTAVVAGELYPLTLALDDLQWADESSRAIIQSLLDPAFKQGLFLILAYRSSPLAYSAKVCRVLHQVAPVDSLRIELGGLTMDAIKNMLEDVFGGALQEGQQLTRWLYRWSAGNPLFVKQMLSRLLEQNGIYYDQRMQVWRLDWRVMGVASLPDSSVEIIQGKTEGLSPDLLQLLEVASCIGSRFSLASLQLITGESLPVLESRIETLSRLGLIVDASDQASEYGVREYEFFHERIYQSVYQGIDPDRKEQLHLRIATALLSHPNRTMVERNLLSIASHLLASQEELNRRGGSEKDTLFDIKRKQMVLSFYMGEYDRVIELGIETLSCLGVRIRLHQLDAQIAKEVLLGMRHYRNTRPRRIENPSLAASRHWKNVLEMLYMMATSARFRNGKLFAFLTLKIGNIVSAQGQSPCSPVAYAAYSLILGSVLGQYDKGAKLKVSL